MAGYGTDDGLEAWAASQGLVLPGTVNLTAMRQIGSDYLDAAYESKLSCSRRTEEFEQERAWPRTGHRIGRGASRRDVPPDLIPPAWVNASYRAAYLEAIEPGWATETVDPNLVTKREKVDVLEREYFAPSDVAASASSNGMPSDAFINGLVAPWLCPGGRDLSALFRVV